MDEGPPKEARPQTRGAVLLSRRSLLRFGLGALGVLTIAGGAARWLFWDRLKDAYLRVAYPALAPGLKGRLDSTTLTVLIDVAELLLGAPPAARYSRYFEWHATHVDGYLSLYGEFVAYLDAQARKHQGLSFVDCSVEDRRAILMGIMRQRVDPRMGSDLTRFWRGATHRRLVLFDRFVLQEILNLYSKTDAWLALGYEAFPGMPVGLEDYRQPPPGV